jgi:di/tripeptidase
MPMKTVMDTWTNLNWNPWQTNSLNACEKVALAAVAVDQVVTAKVVHPVVEKVKAVNAVDQKLNNQLQSRQI